MAKAKYTNVAGVNPEIELNYTMGHFGLLQSKKTSATYVDSETNFQVVFIGKNMEYTDESGLVKGTVTQIQFKDGENSVFADITGLDIAKVKKLEDILTGSGDLGGVNGLLAKVLEKDDDIIGSNGIDTLSGEDGNDIIKGKSGDDLIYGNGGDDEMTGGGGSDMFVFLGATGKDVVTDYDIGNGEVFDTIFIRNVTFDEVKASGNVLKYVFTDGSSVLFEGVKYSERGEMHVDILV